MLYDILPAHVRKIAYIVYAVGAVILGVTQIVLNGYGLDPQWYSVAADVWLYLGAAVGAVAAGNTPPRHRAEP